MTETILIPLNNLVTWDGNVRKTGAADNIEELMASIQAHGLLQPLVVKPAGGKAKGKYHVVAGQRRLMALNGINYAQPVPCTVIAADADATEISLVENTIRQQMHPIDQFHAFRQLQESGSSPADIAARFGYAESTVLKILKLARVSPKILDAYRASDLTMEHVQAFASTDDTERQEQVFADFNPDYNDADDIRSELTPEGDIPATDKRALYVGIDAYVKAGGKIRPELFTEQQFLLDAELLDELAAQKLTKQKKKIAAEGWAWIEIVPDLSWEIKQKHGRIREDLILTPKQQEHYDTLQAEAEKLNDQWYESEGDTDKPERLIEVEAEIEKIEEGAYGYRPEEIAIAGCFITLDRQGKIDIERGMVKPEDKPRLKALAKAQNEGNDPEAVAAALSSPEESAGTGDDKKGMSASLIEELTRHRTAALAVSLAQNPDVALATIVYTLAAESFRQDYTGLYSCLEIHGKSGNVYFHPKGTQAERDLENEEHIVRDRIPAADNLWQWCLQQDRDTLLNTLAFLAGQSVNAIRKKTDRPDDSRLEHADMLARALKLNMSLYFRPDAENYFGKISKDMILADIRDITGKEPSPAQMKAKKSELAAMASKLADGTGWLPTILRVPDDGAEDAKPKAMRKKRAA